MSGRKIILPLILAGQAIYPSLKNTSKLSLFSILHLTLNLIWHILSVDGKFRSAKIKRSDFLHLALENACRFMILQKTATLNFCAPCRIFKHFPSTDYRLSVQMDKQIKSQMRILAVALIFGGESMRKAIESQMTIGEVSIADIGFDLRSRDEIPKVLIGLQEIYCNRPV